MLTLLLQLKGNQVTVAAFLLPVGLPDHIDCPFTH